MWWRAMQSPRVLPRGWPWFRVLHDILQIHGVGFGLCLVPVPSSPLLSFAKPSFSHWYKEAIIPPVPRIQCASAGQVLSIGPARSKHSDVSCCMGGVLPGITRGSMIC